MEQNELYYLTIAEAAAGLRRKQFSPVELAEACLDRIEAHDAKLHSFITLTADLALAQARQAETRIAQRRQDRGPLHGIPIALKDLYTTKGIRTTCHSAVLEHWLPDQDATAVSQTRRCRHESLLGKLGMHEFAFGGPSVDAPFPGRDAIRGTLAHIPGGSSSGSGAALAAGFCLRRPGLRHRRLDSYPFGTLWHRRHQTDLRPCQPLWRHTAELVPGSCRSDGAKRRRLRHHAASRSPATTPRTTLRRMCRWPIFKRA